MTQGEQPPQQVGIQSNNGGDIDLKQSQVNIAGRDLHIHSPSNPRPGSAPLLPALIVGREGDLRDLKTRLRAYPNNPAARKVIKPQAKWRKAR